MSNDLTIAKQLTGEFVYEASRLSVALRALSEAHACESEEINQGVRDGLMEAACLLGEHMENFATDRHASLERIEAERNREAKQ